MPDSVTDAAPVLAALDLRTYRKTTFDLTVTDELVLHIRKPSQELLIQMQDAQARMEAAGENLRELFPVVEDFICEAFSNNREGVLVDKEWLDEYEVDAATSFAMFGAFGTWVGAVMSDPNSASPRKA